MGTFGDLNHRPILRKDSHLFPKSILAGKRFKLQVCSFRKWLELLEEWTMSFAALKSNCDKLHIVTYLNKFLGVNLISGESTRHIIWHFIYLGLFSPKINPCAIYLGWSYFLKNICNIWFEKNMLGNSGMVYPVYTVNNYLLCTYWMLSTILATWNIAVSHT